MTGDTEHPMTVADRYAKAIHSSDLLLRYRNGDADVLIAAGRAAQESKDVALALVLLRASITGDRGELTTAADVIGDWLVGFNALSGRPMPRAARLALAKAVLLWRFEPICQYCAGRKWLTIDDAPKLTTQACDACHGLGKRPLDRDVPASKARQARWLVQRLDELEHKLLGALSRWMNAP